MYVPALARAHLAAESVISANKVSLGLKGVAGGPVGEAEGECPPFSSDLPFARATHTHVYMCASACTGAYTYTRTNLRP